MEMKNSICFAYFGDGQFIGWYSDTFGTITSNGPKVYTNSEKQIEIIEQNFNYQISKAKDKAKSELAEKTGIAALSLLDNGLNSHRKKLSDYSSVELRVVECPHYDGQNPDWDKDAWEKIKNERKEKMTAEGIFEIPAPSTQRSEAIKAFDEKNPLPKNESWIYVNYSLVKEWASNEPTEFLKVLTPNK